MNLIMITGDRTLRSGKKSPFYFTLQTLHSHFDRVDVLCYEVKEFKNFDEPLFGNVYLHPFSGTVFSLYSYISTTVKNLFKQNSKTVMTCHAYSPFIHAIAACALAKKLHIPLLVEWHGMPKVQLSSFRESVGAVLLPFAIFATKNATGIRSVSTKVSSILKKFGVSATKIHQAEAVYIDSHIFTPRVVQTQYTMVFCGRIDANKRLDLCIQSLLHLQNATLAIIGDGPQYTKMKALAKKLQVDNRITWFGYIEDPHNIASIIQSSQLLIMLSMYEGGPRVVVEALACGVPVVATNVGLVPDVVRSGINGIICTHKIADIVEAVSTILSMPHYSTNAKKMSLTLQTQFSREILFTKYINILQRLSD